MIHLIAGIVFGLLGIINLYIWHDNKTYAYKPSATQSDGKHVRNNTFIGHDACPSKYTGNRNVIIGDKVFTLEEGVSLETFKEGGVTNLWKRK